MADGGTVARLAARMLERQHVTRAGVSRISVLMAVGAAVWFSRADTVGGLAGSAFLGAVLLCDAVRERMRDHQRDALTLWLALMLARLREFVVYLGLAAGAVAAQVPGAWGWAAGALVALALRDSLLAAASSPEEERNVTKLAPPSRRRAEGLLGGLAPREPRESDPALTARLFGGAAMGPGPVGSGSAPPAPARSGGSAGAEGPSPACEGPLPAARTPLGRAVSFSQPVRFAAIAVTATLWDARVAFCTLALGCTIAVIAHVFDPAGHGKRR